jgi:Bax protein
MKSILFILGLNITIFAMGLPKEYYKLKGSKQKEYFFNHFYQIMKQENIKVLNDRKFIKNFFSSVDIFSINPYSNEFQQLLKLKKSYKIKNIYDYKSYLKHIDIVPPSLALAQAAVESGWGKSRFVKEANNVFGQWTYTGKGLIPASRDEGATHKIKIFDSIGDAMGGYIKNLNVGWAYKDYRTQRENIRESSKNPTGKALSKTLINYSQIREKYIKILDDMIEHNNLNRFDTKFYNEIGGN